MAYTTINKSTDYFNTKIYTGNESAGHAITGVGFQPDFTWFKNRGGTDSHSMYDAVRGVTKQIESDTTGAETTESTGLASFDSDGFTVGTRTASNSNNMSICSWNWKANGQGSANNDGSTNTTYTSANTTAGISIVKWTPSGSAETVGHGLGAVPKMIITKNLGASQGWFTYHHSIGNTKYLLLNTTAAEATDSNAWNNTTPTSSVFSVGSQFAGSDYVAYCFAEIQGFSKIGSYVANGSNDGAFCYTGFKPGFIMIKSSTTAMYWHIFDNKRLGYNAYNYRLNPNANEVETTTTDVIDILSNGFKIRTNQQQFGTSGATYIYMAFAEAPIVGSNNVPCTAR
jgi:hypothetical protein